MTRTLDVNPASPPAYYCDLLAPFQWGTREGPLGAGEAEVGGPRQLQGGASMRPRPGLSFHPQPPRTAPPHFLPTEPHRSWSWPGDLGPGSLTPHPSQSRPSPGSQGPSLRYDRLHPLSDFLNCFGQENTLCVL